MAIKNIISMGVGFNPGSTDFIPTLGFSLGEVAPPSTVTHVANMLSPSFSLYSLALFFIGWIKWH